MQLDPTRERRSHSFDETFGRDTLTDFILNGEAALMNLVIENMKGWEISGEPGKQALLLASYQRSAKIVDDLLKAGVPTNVVDGSERSPLHLAAFHGREENVRILLDFNADIDCQDKDGETPITLAEQNGHESIVIQLQQEKLKRAHAKKSLFLKEDPLYQAIVNKDTILAEHLIAKMDIIAIRGLKGEIALLFAAKYNDPNVLRSLLKRGVDVAVKDEKDRTPLHYAALYGFEEITRILLLNGASLEARDNQGKTPIDLAQEGFSHSVAQFLMNEKQRIEQEKLTLTLRNELFYESLVHKHAALSEAMALSLPESDIYGPKGRHAILVASSCGSTAVVEILLDRGVPVNIMNKDGLTPLHIAAFFGREETVSLLLERGAKTNVADRIGETPLSLAEQNKHDTIVSLLQQQINKKTLKGKTVRWKSKISSRTQNDTID